MIIINIIVISFQGRNQQDIMETAVLNLLSLYDKLRMQADVLNENIEPSE